MPVYTIDKPLGPTSHDVVARARKLLGTKRVGHAGTLDPLATGVLVILSEDATKLSPFLTASDKHYLAWVSFGGHSPTLDAEGPLEDRQDASRLTREAVLAALPPFLELNEQLPPQYSAVKKGGVKGYQAARRGDRLELQRRPAGYERIELLGFAASREALPSRFGLSPHSLDWRPHDEGMQLELPQPLGDFPTALVSLRVKAGTYVRAFARDLGEALGLPAHLSGLVRTRAGKNGLEAALRLETIAGASGLSNAEALPYPLLSVNQEEERSLLQGKPVALEIDGYTGLVAEDGWLVAVVEPKGHGAKVVRAWPR